MQLLHTLTHTQSAESRAPQRHSTAQNSRAEQTGSERTPVQPHSKAEESSLQRVITGATATSAQVMQELAAA